MKISVLGTGNVGQTFATKLVSLGHQVMIGTRNVDDTLNRKSGSKSFEEWLSQNSAIKIGTFKDAVGFGEIIINALQGAATISAIKSCNENDFDEKIIIDIANPLDFSHGFPPTLLEGLNNTNSLGEELQKALPNAKIVKTLNTMTCDLMVNPSKVNDGNHINYICGNDAHAKIKVTALLNEFGWKNENILDLGNISNARGTEGILPIWCRIYAATNNGMFNFQIRN